MMVAVGQGRGGDDASVEELGGSCCSGNPAMSPCAGIEGLRV